MTEPTLDAKIAEARRLIAEARKRVEDAHPQRLSTIEYDYTATGGDSEYALTLGDCIDIANIDEPFFEGTRESTARYLALASNALPGLLDVCEWTLDMIEEEKPNMVFHSAPDIEDIADRIIAALRQEEAPDAPN